MINRVNVQLSKNFVDSSQSATANLLSDHGTHVAGIIGAEANNGLGITGVCQDVELIALRVDYVNSFGQNVTNLSAVVQAIKYADENNIDILNYSAGTPTFSSYVESIVTQIQHFDGLFVCAVGKNNLNRDEFPYYPSDYKLCNLISVGASTSDDTKASFSDYGKTKVDIFAPGMHIYSTVFNNGYEYHDGTSMAAPIVTGVAALLLSKYPQLTPAELKYYIMHSVDKNSTLEELCVSGGRINAYEALLLANHTHNFDCDDDDDNTSVHVFTCLICGFEKREPHVWQYTSIDSRQHLVQCLVCDFKYTEAHVLNLLTGICKSCGYNSNDMGTLNRLLGLLQTY